MGHAAGPGHVFGLYPSFDAVRATRVKKIGMASSARSTYSVVKRVAQEAQIPFLGNHQ
jgi:hypothetical protein